MSLVPFKGKKKNKRNKTNGKMVAVTDSHIKAVAKTSGKLKQIRSHSFVGMSTLNAASSWNFHDLTAMEKGSQINQREGDQAKFTGTMLTIVAHNNRGIYPRFIRIVLFRERGFGFFSETNNNLCWNQDYNELFWDGKQGDLTAPVNTNNYTVYSDRTFLLEPVDRNKTAFKKKYFIKHATTVNYTPLDVGYSIQRSGRIYLVWGIADGSTQAGTADQVNLSAFTQTYYRDTV